MSKTDLIIGKAKAVFLIKDGSDENAVISSVIARQIRSKAKQRLFFTGQATFDARTRKHIRKNVLPIADSILSALRPRCKPKKFDLSIVNVNAASVNDLGLEISGFSADLTVFLAILSAALEIPVLQDVLATGHIASSDGDIRCVAGFKAKSLAAMEDRTISRFIYPNQHTDASMARLCPCQAADIEAFGPFIKDKIQFSKIDTLTELITYVFRRADIIEAALKYNFFSKRKPLANNNTCAGSISRYMADNEKHFWKILQSYALENKAAEFKDLLTLRVRYQIRRRRYPASMGRRLFSLMLATPPVIWRVNRFFPLIPTEIASALLQYSKEEDISDARDFANAIQGRLNDGRINYKKKNDPGCQIKKPSDHEGVRTVLNEISIETISEKIGRPLDQARAGYVLNTITIDNPSQFGEIVTSFYLYLVNNASAEPKKINVDILHVESFELLERAFRNNGGCKAALSSALEGINGGMRYIFDAMTEQLKSELAYEHINYALKQAVDPLCWKERVEFMQSFLEYIRPHLSDEFMEITPAELAHDDENKVIKAYLNSIEYVNKSFRNF